jgi:hypothetical protein
VEVNLIGDTDVSVSIHNQFPTPVCTSKSSWIKGGVANSILRVSGVDGKEWKFVGLWVEPGGDERDVLRLAPGETLSATVRITKFYQPPPGADPKIGLVEYQGRFVQC